MKSKRRELGVLCTKKRNPIKATTNLSMALLCAATALPAFRFFCVSCDFCVSCASALLKAHANYHLYFPSTISPTIHFSVGTSYVWFYSSTRSHKYFTFRYNKHETAAHSLCGTCAFYPLFFVISARLSSGQNHLGPVFPKRTLCGCTSLTNASKIKC